MKANKPITTWAGASSRLRAAALATLSLFSLIGNSSGFAETPNVVAEHRSRVAVPRLIALEESQAVHALARVDLDLGPVRFECDDNVPPGTVLRQFPGPGVLVDRDSRVSLVVSKGPRRVEVPKVIGLTQSAAASVITGARLKVGTITQQASDTVPAGVVIAESPLAGGTVCIGSAVNLIVSKGKPQSTSVPMIDTTQFRVSVQLPTALKLTADRTRLITSVAQVTPGKNGAASITGYVNGEQLAIVLNPTGNPMLMGWIDANHTIVNSNTTAQVLAYFALAGTFVLNPTDREAVIADLQTNTALSAITGVIEAELARDSDAFASGVDAKLAAAVAAFAQPYFSTSQASQSRLHVNAIAIDPVNPQSGINLLQDPPFSAHLTNSYRRRAYAFVDRVSHTTDGVQVPDAASVTSFDIPPTNGVNGGVTGALNDIVNAYFGNQPTAYADVNAPDGGISVPLIEGSQKTTYQVTVVGPGATAGAALTPAQTNKMYQVSLQAFLQDLASPVVLNLFFGSNYDFSKGTPDEQKFAADFLANLTADFINYAPTIPGFNDLIANGRWHDAGVMLFSTALGSSSFSNLVLKAVEAAVKRQTSQGIDPGNLTGLFKSYGKLMNAAGGVLQVIDTAAITHDVSQSARGAQWKIDVSQVKVNLNPPSSTIGYGGVVQLATVLPGVDDLSGYSFHWTTTTNVGDLAEAGGGRTHQTDYCSSSYAAAFVWEPGAIAGASDTITVEAFSGPGCAANLSVGKAQATVTYQPSETLTVSPASTQASPGDVIQLSTTLTPAVQDPNAIITYAWTLSGNAGGTLSSTSEGPNSSNTYTASANATGSEQDTVTVTAYQGSTKDSSVHVKLASATANITFGNPWVGVWVGNTVSTCGYYSGPQTFNITQIDATTLDFGPYTATFSGNEASVNNGAVTFELDGNTMTGHEADSCQTGHYTRQ